MKCPDCRNVQLDLIKYGHGKDYDVMEFDNAIWKCPVCKTEFDPEDLEESHG